MKILAVGIAALGVTRLGANAADAQSMTLTSPEIKEGATIANEQVFGRFGCTGGNISPSLKLERRANRHQELCRQHL